MSIEDKNQAQLEQQESLKDRQRKIDLQNYDKFLANLENSNISIEDIQQGLLLALNEDPNFKADFNKFQYRISEATEKRLSEVNKTGTIETENINKAIPTQLEIISKNPNFKEFSHCFKESKNGSLVLPTNTYLAFTRYGDNKTPLIEAVAGKELEVATKSQNERLKAITTDRYNVSHRDEAIRFANTQFNEEKAKIFQKYIPVAEKLFKFLSDTDLGKQVIVDTIPTIFVEQLEDNINRNLGVSRQKGSVEESTETTTDKIKLQTLALLGKIQTIQAKLNTEIQTYKKEQENLKQRDYITRERILYKDIPMKYAGEISREIKEYTKSVGKEITLSNSITDLVKNGKVFNLPLGNGNEVVLDFGELPEPTLESFEKNFDKIYRDTFFEKISSELLTKKGAIDISGVVFGGVVTAATDIKTGGLGIPASAAVFTASENIFRAGMYKIFEIEGGWQAGVGIDLKTDTTGDILGKKGFEIVSNGILFGVFKGVNQVGQKIVNKMGTKELSNAGKVIDFSAKTGIEATFFTLYMSTTSKIQETIANGGNVKELKSNLLNVLNIDDLSRLFVYNLGFITAIKGGVGTGKFAGKGGEVVLNKLQEEYKKLLEKGYSFNGKSFFDSGGKRVQNTIPEFKGLIEANKEVGKLAIESNIEENTQPSFQERVQSHNKPNSGRGGRESGYPKADQERKWRELQKNSGKVKEKGISEALKDKEIGSTLENSGLQGGKGIGEGLLYKSGFSKDEINQFKRGELKGEKPLEVKAVGEMNEAMRVVVQEYDRINIEIYKGLSNGKNPKEILKDLGYNSDVINKILSLKRKSLF